MHFIKVLFHSYYQPFNCKILVNYVENNVYFVL